MQTSLRKMGNSVGLIVPRAMLSALGASTGTRMEVAIEDGKLVATPAPLAPRQGWAEAALLVASAEEDPDEAAWHAFDNDGDADLTW